MITLEQSLLHKKYCTIAVTFAPEAVTVTAVLKKHLLHVLSTQHRHEKMLKIPEAYVKTC